MNVVVQRAMQFGVLERMSVDRKQMRLGVIFLDARAIGKLREQLQAGFSALLNRGAAELAGAVSLDGYTVPRGMPAEILHYASRSLLLSPPRLAGISFGRVLSLSARALSNERTAGAILGGVRGSR